MPRCPEGNPQAKPHRPSLPPLPSIWGASRWRTALQTASSADAGCEDAQALVANLCSVSPASLHSRARSRAPDAGRTSAAYLRQVFAVLKTGRGPTALCLRQRREAAPRPLGTPHTSKPELPPPSHSAPNHPVQ